MWGRTYTASNPEAIQRFRSSMVPADLSVAGRLSFAYFPGVDPSLDDLFSSEPYRFHMGLSRGSIQSFFEPGPHHLTLMEERRRWLQETPEACLACCQGEEVMAEFA